MAQCYLIDHILPCQQVHIIGGPSGVGKTRWTYWWIKDWLEGKTIFGYESRPEPTMYLATDRNTASLTETLTTIGCLGLIEQQSIVYRTDVSIDMLHRRYPHIKVFIIDPISVFVPGYHLNDYGIVSSFLRHCSFVCERDEITIIGMIHATKIKEGARLINPRERLLGSAAWGAFAETLFVLGCDNPEVTNAVRHFYILPRNWKEEKMYFTLENGWPKLADAPEEGDRYALFILQVPEDEAIPRTDLLRLATALGIAPASFDRYLKRAIDEGYLLKIRHGVYRKRPTT